jgi:hypothetical protein
MRIVRGQTNKIALTLTEKATDENSDFIIELTNDVSGKAKIFSVFDISEFPYRANIFLLTETENEDLSDGKIYLPITGQYTYRAYEMASSSPRNLNKSDAIKEVEIGRCTVYDPNEVSNVTFNEDENKDNAVFDE